MAPDPYPPEPKYTKVAADRQKAAGSEGKKGGRPKKGEEKTLPVSSRKGKANNETRNQAAASTGYSEATLRKVAKIKAAAAERPELYPPDSHPGFRATICARFASKRRE